MIDIERCQAILRRHMLRRKKDSKLDGKQLITLPEKHVEMRVLEFSPEERDICQSFSPRLYLCHHLTEAESLRYVC